MTKEQITAEGAVDRYADMVYRLALSQMKNRADADDLFQEVFVRLVGNVHKLESWEHVKAWLIRVTVNCARKHFDQYWNKNVSGMEEAEQAENEVENDVLVGVHPVRLAVESLPSKYRLVIHLFYYEQFSVREIAKMTDRKESTVKSRLFRAREMLKELLEGDPDL